MTTIVAHPVNIRKLKAEIQVSKSDLMPDVGIAAGVDGLEFIENPYLEQDRPTGRYVLPTGDVVEKHDVYVDERFIEYGPEDLGWLLKVGLVKEERKPVLYQVDERLMNKLGFGFNDPQLEKPYVSSTDVTADNVRMTLLNIF